MLDGQIVKAIITEIRTQLEWYGIASGDLRISRSNQPTVQYQGATTNTEKYQVFITPVTNIAIGWSRKYNGTLDFTHVKQKSFQISTLVDFDPSDLNDIPANDLAQIINDTLQQTDAIKNLRDAGVFLHECQPVRPIFVVNGANEYESEPSFDIVVSYNAVYSKPYDIIEDVQGTVDTV